VGTASLLDDDRPPLARLADAARALHGRPAPTTGAAVAPRA